MNLALLAYKNSKIAKDLLTSPSKVSNWRQKSLFNRIARRLFWDYIYYDLDTEARSNAQLELMGEEEALKWAHHHASQREIQSASKDDPFPPIRGTRFHGQLEFNDAFPLFEYLAQIIRVQSHGLCVQLGSSSGKEIAYFSSLTKNMSFIGYDLYESSTSFATKRYRSENLDFKTGDFLSALNENPPNRNDPVIIFSNGSLLYMFPEDAVSFFAKVASFENPLSLIISEPVRIPGISKVLKTGTVRQEAGVRRIGLSVPSGSMGYSHDYIAYALINGLKLKHVQYGFPHPSTDVVNALFHLTN